MDSICCTHETFVIIIVDQLIDLIRSLILFHSYSYIFSVPLLLAVETSAKYLFSLLSSMDEGFGLLIVV